jgi:hypothetical protein
MRGPAAIALNRIVTAFGNKEFAAIKAFCRSKRISLYTLAKTAIREYIDRHS